MKCQFYPALVFCADNRAYSQTFKLKIEMCVFVFTVLEARLYLNFHMLRLINSRIFDCLLPGPQA